MNDCPRQNPAYRLASISFPGPRNLTGSGGFIVSPFSPGTNRARILPVVFPFSRARCSAVPARFDSHQSYRISLEKRCNLLIITLS